MQWLLLLFPTLILGKRVVLHWNISRIVASPDGYSREVIAVNGQFPTPIVNVQKGDELIINLTNSLKDEDTSLHAHGIFEKRRNSMDGAQGVTQCGIPPGLSMSYHYFLTDQVGTYWIHSHTPGQYPDGLRAPLIIQDIDKKPYTYDEEYIITLSDWYHDRMKILIPIYMNVNNPEGDEPVPKSALINDQLDAKFPFVKGKTYRLRIVNISTYAHFNFWLEDHEMTVIEADGVYTNPATTTSLRIDVAQRYSVLVTAKDDATANYAMVASMDTTQFDNPPTDLNPNATAYIVYNTNWPLPQAQKISEYTSWDETILHPLEEIPSFIPDTFFQLNLTMDTLADGINYALFNNISYTMPKVPTLHTVFSSGERCTDPSVYNWNTNPLVLKYGDFIQVIIANKDDMAHPIHLHGHLFQIISRGETAYDPSKPIKEPRNPIRRDVAFVPGNGYLIIRFKADNPGIWICHCHIEWHMIAGMAVTFIESPEIIQLTQTIPEADYEICNRGKPRVLSNIRFPIPL